MNLGSQHLVVIVNNEFLTDPRVHRTVMSLRETFARISVISGAPRPVERKRETLQNVTIHRHRFFKPNFGGARLIRRATILAVGSPGAATRPPGLGARLMRNALFCGWLAYLLLMNLVIVARYWRLAGDIYYANDLDTLLAGYLLARLHRARLVYDAHELYPDLLENSPRFYYLLLNRLEGVLARRAAALFTVNASIADILRQRHHLPSAPTVIYNCPPFQATPPRESPSSLPYKLLFHGVYLPGRNLEGLVLSMRHVENAHLYLRGYGVLEDALRRLVEQHNLHDRVTFLEAVPMSEMVARAAEFDIGVIPYPGHARNLNSYYCTPNKIFEYMMAGLALVVSDLPELRRIVSVYGVGVTFDPAAEDGLGRALRGLSPAALHQMQANALTAAREVWNFEAETHKLRAALGGIGEP